MVNGVPNVKSLNEYYITEKKICVKIPGKKMNKPKRYR